MSRLAILFIVVTVILSSCEKGHRCDCFMGNGNSTTEIRNTENFDGLELHGVFDYFVHRDTVCKVAITGGQNTIAGIETSISDGKLVIRNHNRCNWVRLKKDRIKIDIYYKSLKTVFIDGSCDLTFSDTLVADEFTVDNYADVSKITIPLKVNTLRFGTHAGTGDFTLSGQVPVAYLFSHGNGYFHCENLELGYCYITSNSTGDCTVRASQAIHALLQSSGDIFYYGNPNDVKKQEESTGKLIKAG